MSRTTFFIKNQNFPRNPSYGAPGLQNERPGFKNDRPGLKNDRKFDHFADKNQDSCSQANKEIRANKEIKANKEMARWRDMRAAHWI